MSQHERALTRAEFIKRTTGMFALAFFGVDLPPLRRATHSGFPHPDPRPGVTAEHVLAATEIGEKKAVIEAYDAARTYPEIFDGLYCACQCRDPLGHRSLLACFESKQATGCMGCREEALLVAKLAKEGKTLDEIRKAVDKEWSS
jgi:hypothetical protein